MIALLSQNYAEDTTDEIIDWLTLYKADCVRINGEYMLDEDAAQTIRLSNKSENSFCSLNLSDFEVLWFRRWNQFEMEEEIFNNPNITPLTKHKLFSHLIKEASVVNSFLFSQAQSKKWIDKPSLHSLNKLKLLSFAQKAGLRIPETLVTNKSSEVIDFIDQFTHVITKPISEVDIFEIEGKNYCLDTKLVKKSDIIKQESGFFYPSLFQEAIPKKYEIRTFYLDNRFYSMAIFSQRRKESKYDYRVYDYDKPDRMIPYQLSSKIEKQLLSLVKMIDIKHCSIDGIITDNLEFVFLEINPIGQFGMVSKPCNYYLEKKMANYLIHEEEKLKVKNT